MDYFHIEATPGQLAGLSNLGLAHMGDGVYELMVRSYLCLHGKSTNKGLHKAAVGYVSAAAQSAAVRVIEPMLTEAEQEVFRRGRNASPHTIPPHAKREDYARATALEALFGWLWLRGETGRLNELFEKIMEETLWP